MKISDFISKLEQYKEERGDLEMLFSVYDYFGHTVDAKPSGSERSRFWEGTSTNGTQVRFDIHLEGTDWPGEGKKNPLISFRK